MTAVVSLSVPSGLSKGQPVQPFRLSEDSDAHALINHLRLVGLRCRAARQAPPIEACALIAMDASEDAVLTLLMRVLPQALGRLPVFYAPGSAELSFDEAWLLQLIHALRSGDVHSSAFLLRSRVPSYARRSLVFLLKHALPMDLN